MTTLAANKPRAYEGGSRNELPVIASDIIYEGAAVGIVPATGHARPLAAGDKFGGIAEAKADNSTGSAADINVRTIESGKVQLTVTGVVITDVGQPVYASDDDTFTMLPTAGPFVGFVHRWVSSGVAVVAFDALNYKDPYGGGTYEVLSASTKTLDVLDSGKVFFVTEDCVITLPAVATPPLCKIVCAGPYGTVQISVSPNANDMIEGPDITAANDKDIINTKATAKRGDYVVIDGFDADGYILSDVRGTWAREA